MDICGHTKWFDFPHWCVARREEIFFLIAQTNAYQSNTVGTRQGAKCRPENDPTTTTTFVQLEEI
jgi:hypothetical protein